MKPELRIEMRGISGPPELDEAESYQLGQRPTYTPERSWWKCVPRQLTFPKQIRKLKLQSRLHVRSDDQSERGEKGGIRHKQFGWVLDTAFSRARQNW